jgi:hypothetical protein
MAYSTLNGLNGGRASKKKTRHTRQIQWAHTLRAVQVCRKDTVGTS